MRLWPRTETEAPATAWIPSSPIRFRALLLLCGVGIGSYVVAALLLAPGADLPRHMAWFMISFAFYLLAVWVVLACERQTPESRAVAGDLALILGVALLLRAGLLATTPSLSDDVFRYVWDGKVVNAGLDPYRYPPAAPELESLRGAQWEGINHKSMATPYPPAAEALFAAAYRLAPDSLRAMQAMAVAFDLGVVLLLIPMLARFGLDRRRILVYAWNPLVLLQFSHSAHYDAAMMLPLLGALYMVAVGRKVLSGALLGVSVLIKLVPAVAAPLFLPLWGLGGLLAMGAVTAIGLLPWVAMGTAAGGVLTEAADARFNDSLGYLLVKLLERGSSNPEAAARTIAAGVLLSASFLLLGLLWKRGAEWKGLLLHSYWLLGLFVLLNAVVEPWYLTWIVPFLCFALASGRRGLPRLQPAWGWLLLSGLVVLTDLTYLPRVGVSLWVWVRAVEYLPLYGLLALWAWRQGAQLLPRLR
ncbi:MAG: hypothetical protein ACYC66_17450 [Chloroflexota bacterium]